MALPVFLQCSTDLSWWSSYQPVSINCYVIWPVNITLPEPYWWLSCLNHEMKFEKNYKIYQFNVAEDNLYNSRLLTTSKIKITCAGFIKLGFKGLGSGRGRGVRKIFFSILLDIWQTLYDLINYQLCYFPFIFAWSF